MAQESPPTVEDVQAIGTAAAGAATETSQSGGTPDEAGQAAAAAAAAEAKARNIELPEAVIQQIAKASAAATVAELSQQKAIVAGAPDPESESDDDGDQDGDQDADQGKDDPPPRKLTIAEKLLAPYQR
jgi:hypothetical protein